MYYVLAIDQGTTSSRAIVFRSDISIAASAQAEFPQHFPASGWVEHEPEDIWTSTMATCREALKKAGVGPKDIAAIGITNQRETTVVWDRATGTAVHRAIVWQDRRTADICAHLKAEGHEPAISAKTGLIIDPYFSGTKVAWILDHVPGARERADRGELMFGTVDCYLLWRLTGGRLHCTARTQRRPHHRAAVPRGLHAHVDLRHWLFCPAQHRHHAGGLKKQAADHDRLSAEGPAHLRARRLDLRRGLGGAVAARRPRHHQAGQRDRPARRQLRLHAERLSGAGLRRPRRALLESARARRAVRADPQHRPGRARACRPRERLLPDL